MAKKIDLSGMKEFFFNHGEKVALGTCAFLALVLGLWGLWGAAGAGRPDGSSKSFPEEFNERTKLIRDQMTAAPIPKLEAVDTKKFKWNDLISRHQPTDYVTLGEADASKRRNPLVLPINSDKKMFQLDYVAGLTNAYKTGRNLQNHNVVTGLVPVNAEEAPLPPKEKKGKKDPPAPINIPPFMQVGKPRRMVVVHAVFPMKQQVEEFRKALKMNDQGDMFKTDRDDLPRPVGIDVLRFEVVNGEPAKDYVVVLLADSAINNGRLQINPKLEEALRESMYDERAAEVLENWIWFGLQTPMPKLANKRYPRFEFPGIEVDWAGIDDVEKREGMIAMEGPKGPVGPRKEGGKQPGFQIKKKEQPPMGDPGQKKPEVDYKPTDILAKNLEVVMPELASRLFPAKDKQIDEYLNVYHVLGLQPDLAAQAEPPPVGIPPRGQNQAKMAGRFFTAWAKDPPEPAKGDAIKVPVKGGKDGPGAAPQAPPHPPWERDALVRFVDVDVVPGKEYFYSIRVHMANPNFMNPGEKKKEVAFEALARNKELEPSPWVNTPRITIPNEYYLYPVDQRLIDLWAEGGEIKKGGPGAPIFSPAKESNETSLQIHQFREKAGDLRGNGDPYVIGDWVVAERQVVRKGDYIGKGVIVQVPAWNELKDAFELPNSPKDAKAKVAQPKGIHVDMMQADGKAPVLVDFTGGKKLSKFNNLDEEVAVDALILMPDGKLKVLNSRSATDTTDPGQDAPEAKIKEVKEAKEREERVLSARRRIEEIRRANAPPVDPKKGPFTGGK